MRDSPPTDRGDQLGRGPHFHTPTSQCGATDDRTEYDPTPHGGFG
jgi:hypothetical protein